MRSNKDNKFLLIWLLINLTLIIMMVAIGGITRLTDSGLSMTNWRLFMGIIPPLNESRMILSGISINRTAYSSGVISSSAARSVTSLKIFLIN